jgi:hypothetical protein
MSDPRLTRWRLLLGGGDDGTGVSLSGREAQIDKALNAVYGQQRGGPRGAGLDPSAPSVARWLGDIREYFPSSVVSVMQKDAIDRLDLHRLLLEPELLEAVEPDVNLVGTLLSLNRVIPAKTRDTARLVVRKVVEALERRLEQKTRAAVIGALDRASRTSSPLASPSSHCSPSPTTALRPTTTKTRRPSQRSASQRSLARPTSSPISWPRQSKSVTSAPGLRARESSPRAAERRSSHRAHRRQRVRPRQPPSELRPTARSPWPTLLVAARTGSTGTSSGLLSAGPNQSRASLPMP